MFPCKDKRCWQIIFMSGEERKGAEFLGWLLSPSMCAQICGITNRFWNEKHLYCFSIQNWERERFRLTKGYLSSRHNINNILKGCSFVNYSICSYRIVSTIKHNSTPWRTLFFHVWWLDLLNKSGSVGYLLLTASLATGSVKLARSMLMLAICPQSFAPFPSGLYASSTTQLMLRIKTLF